MKIEKILDSVNLADELNNEELVKIGNTVVDGFDDDLASRAPWEKDIEKWTELALQISKEKTYPWKGASNVKYPLLATAAMQFHARAYPSLVPADGKVVKTQVIGYDITGEKSAKAERVSKHMSYQVMYEMDDWEEDMDKLLLSLPIVGTIFKKTYWDADKQKNKSCLVFPKNLVVNYWAKSLETAERKTEWFELTKRQIKERQLRGIYKDVTLADPTSSAFSADKVRDTTQVVQRDDDTTPYRILESHTYLDLDKDGLAEPYIVTVEYTSRTVLRIVARFNSSSINVNNEGTIVGFNPDEYYTKFSFVPNPDGGFYDIGFGRLLGTINSAVDTIINQLIDSGTLSNLQSGFIGKGLRIKMGEAKFSPGEWKAVNATGDDLKKQIIPLPVNAPNPVLLQLLQYLVQSGRDLASVAEIMVGKMPGQNTPATTTMASIEQGMKVFTAVYKRIFRSLAKEFRKLYTLNSQYLNPETYISVLDVPVQQEDYKGDPADIIPGADPQAVSNQEKQQRAQMLVQMLGLGTLNPMAVTQYMLEAYEIPQPENFMMQPQPQVDPAAEAKKEEMQMKAQLEEHKARAKMEMDSAKLNMELSAADQKAKLEQAAKVQDLKFKQIQHALEIQKAQAAQEMEAQNHVVQMTRTQQDHEQQMSIKKDQAKNKPERKAK